MIWTSNTSHWHGFYRTKKTKADLTDYLTKATLDYNKNSPQLVITSTSGHTKSNRNMHFEDNNHEEADTLMICLAMEESQRCPNAQLVLFTPDTDVLVLAVAHWQALQKDIYFVAIRCSWNRANLESFEQQKDASYTCIPRIHWSRQCWKILKNRQNKMVSAV